jgi:hypothetical protein
MYHGARDALDRGTEEPMALDHDANDEKQALLTFALLAVMAVLSVALIAYVVLVA